MSETIVPVTTKVDRGDRGDDGLRPAQRLNIVDRAIAFISPSYGVRALVARNRLHQFGYNDHSERRGKSPPLRGSETWVANRDRLKMMADARDAATYDWIGGVLVKLILYICGRLHCKSTTGDEQYDEPYDDYFHGWCGDEKDEETGRTRCDITGRHRLLKQVQMALMGFFVDGDHGLIEVEPIYDGGQIVREFCLQNIEADRIGSPIDNITEEFYIGGVILDPEGSGAVDAYRIYRRTRTNQYTEPQDIPSSSFIHVFDPEKSDEYRGRTKLLRILNDLRDIREWIEAEKIAGKTQSQWAALIGVKDPFQGEGAAAWDGQTDKGTPTQEAQWGKLLKLAEGENFSMLSPSARPSGAFMQFVQTLIRKMSVSLNLPYGFLWDLATLGGVTARIEVQGALRQIQYWQDNVLVGLILNRVRQKVIAQGIAEGVLLPHPNWKKCEWHFGPWITTDAGYEMQADIAGVQTGLLKISEVVGKYGHTVREVLEANASAANSALTVGMEQQLPVEVFAKALWPDITNQKAAFLAPTPIPPPKAGSIEAIGDKGAGKLIEILEKVGDGTLDRESGIETVMRVFSLTRAQADKIVPDEPTKEDLLLKNPPPAAPGGGMKTSSSKPSTSKSKSAKKK